MLYETRVLFIDISRMGMHLGRGNKTAQTSSLRKLKYTGNEGALAGAVESQASKGEQQMSSCWSGSCTQVEIKSGCSEQAQTLPIKSILFYRGLRLSCRLWL